MTTTLDRHPLIDRLVQRMDEEHLTQALVAEQLGVSLRTVQNWLSANAPTPQPRHRRVIVAWLNGQEEAA